MHSDARGAFNEAEMKQSLIESHFPVLPSWEHEVRPFEQLLERQDEGFHGIPGVSHPPQLLWVPSALNGAGLWGWDGDKRSKSGRRGFFSNKGVLMFKKYLKPHLVVWGHQSGRFAKGAAGLGSCSRSSSTPGCVFCHVRFSL